MNKVFSMKDTKVDSKGKKTTITIQTEDPAVIKNLLDNTTVGSKAKAKEGNTSKAKASTKKASSDKKKDSIKAEVREVKPKAKKTAGKKAAKPKALPAPKTKNDNSKARVKSKKTESGKMTVSQFRKKLRGLNSYREEFPIGNDVIVKTGTSYGIRACYDFDDPMTDYSAYTYGFKEKWLIERYLKSGLIVED